MGFWSWLFGKQKKEEVEEVPKVEIIPDESKQQELTKEFVGMKPKYEKVPRDKEMKDYVKSIVKKAESPDSKPVPHSEDKVDKEKVEKYVDKIQGRK